MGDAACIARVSQIVRDAARENPVVVVVSAMSGVTNKLVEAATLSEAGEPDKAAALFVVLRKQHEMALHALVSDDKKRAGISAVLDGIFAEGERLCKGTALLRELSARTMDSISSLGERLSAPMVAGALAELAIPSEAVEATQLIVTDTFHGGAEPLMDCTRGAMRKSVCARCLKKESFPSSPDSSERRRTVFSPRLAGADPIIPPRFWAQPPRRG